MYGTLDLLVPYLKKEATRVCAACCARRFCFLSVRTAVNTDNSRDSYASLPSRDSTPLTKLLR